MTPPAATRRSSPRRYRFSGLLLLLIGGALVHYGHIDGWWWLLQATSQPQLERSLAEGEQQIQQLQQQLAVAQHQTELAEQSRQQLQQSVTTLEQQLLTLEDELAFYRGIIAPEERTAGLQIDRLELTPIGADRIRYRLVLTQIKGNNSSVAGHITMQLQGVSEGEAVVLPLTPMVGSEAADLTFQFRYFQDFTGELQLPAGVEPEWLSVVVQPQGHRYRRFERVVPWPAADGEG